MKYILWFHPETNCVKIALLIRFDEGTNDLPLVACPPSQCLPPSAAQNGLPIPAADSNKILVLPFGIPSRPFLQEASNETIKVNCAMFFWFQSLY